MLFEPTEHLDRSRFHACLQVPIACITGTGSDCVRKPRSSLDLLKGHGGEPLRAADLGNAGVLGVDEMLSACNFPIYTPAWMAASIRHPHNDLPRSSDSQIDLTDGKT